MPQINKNGAVSALVCAGCTASAFYLGQEKIKKGENPLGSFPFNLAVGQAIIYGAKAYCSTHASSSSVTTQEELPNVDNPTKKGNNT